MESASSFLEEAPLGKTVNNVELEEVIR
jgi:hypothetical protein